MGIRIALFFLIVLSSFTFGKEKAIYIVAQTNPKTEDYSWMEKYYLVESFNVYDIVILKKTELELTEKQINDINSEYNKIFPIMLGKARIVRDKEEEIKNLVIKTNDSQKIKDLLIEIAKLKTELSVLDINLFKTIQSILNKKQNEKLNNFLLKNTY
ncbi:MAG: hypothetical protein ABWJ98_03545 [Hydrogenothermaceae bacterium]